MFNRVHILLLGLLLCLSFCAGCSYTHLPSNNFPVTAPNCEEFEIYQALRADIQDDSSLTEMLDAFAAMCQIPMETTCDLYLLEVYTSDFDGKKTVTIKVSYQFEIPSYYEMLEVGFYASYDFDETIADFDEIKFFENDWEGFISYVRDREIFKQLSQGKMIDNNVFAVVW